MNQSLFWIISSANFVCILILTIVNIFTTRKTTFQSGKYKHVNDVNVNTHDKLIIAFSNFLSVLDKDVTLMPTEESSELTYTAKRNELVLVKRQTEKAFYELLLLLAYSQTTSDDISSKIENIRLLYHEMLDEFSSYLFDVIMYESIKDAPKSKESRLKSSLEHNKRYYAVFRNFDEKKKEFTLFVQSFIKNELTVIK